MHVEKRRVAVRIAQSGNDPLDGFFSLALATADLVDCETIFELLNSDQRVIPFIVRSDESVILLTRLNLDWVMAGERVVPHFILPRSYVVSHQERVELCFMTGTTIDGMIQMQGRPANHRVSDFLNNASDFYPVSTRLGTLLVNKARVRETRLVSTPVQGADEPGANGAESADRAASITGRRHAS